LLLTDGAVEDIVTVGGVLDDRQAGVLEHFGAEVPRAVAKSWGRTGGREQVIGQTEVAPLVLAGRVWKRRIEDRQVIAVVDNDSARDAAIRGYSPSLPSAYLVAQL